jgi:hypothetical protein
MELGGRGKGGDGIYSADLLFGRVWRATKRAVRGDSVPVIGVDDAEGDGPSLM